MGWVFIVSLEEGEGAALASMLVATKSSLPQRWLKTKWSFNSKMAVNDCGSLSCSFEVRGDNHELLGKTQWRLMFSLNQRFELGAGLCVCFGGGGGGGGRVYAR